MSHIPQRPFSVDMNEYPFKSHWFEQDGTFMHYLDEGEGLPVLLFHGNPTWSFLYRKVIKQLDGTCRAIAPDYPGFGMSQHPIDYGYTPEEHAGWVKALIDHLSLDRYVLMVQDWGGPIGMSIAVERPDDVAGLVIANTWGWRAEDFMFKAFSGLIGGPIGKYLILNHNFFAKRIMPMLLTRPEVKTKKIIDNYTKPFPTKFERMGTYVFPREINKSGKWLASIESKLHVLAEKPIELLMGSRDFGLGNDRVIERWQKHFKNANVTRVPDAGHYIQEEAPAQVASAIKRMIERQADDSIS